MIEKDNNKYPTLNKMKNNSLLNKIAPTALKIVKITTSMAYIHV